jgi:hypothetical protein
MNGDPDRGSTLRARSCSRCTRYVGGPSTSGCTRLRNYGRVIHAHYMIVHVSTQAKVGKWQLDD